MPANWKGFGAHATGYGFAVPAAWVDRYGAASQAASAVLDPATLAETGTAPGTALQPDVASAPGTGLPTPDLRIFAFPAVASAAAAIRARMVDFYASAGNQLLDTSLAACIGGESAYGLELLFGKGASFFELLVVEHAGQLYLVEWISNASNVEPTVFAELLLSWSWPGAGPGPSPAPSQSSADTGIEKLKPFVPAAIWAHCVHSTDPVPASVVETAKCQPVGGVAAVWYDLYDNAADLDAAISAAAKSLGAVPGANCTPGPADTTWTFKFADGKVLQGPGYRLICSSTPNAAFIQQADPADAVLFRAELVGRLTDLYSWWTSNTTLNLTEPP